MIIVRRYPEDLLVIEVFVGGLLNRRASKFILIDSKIRTENECSS